MDNGSSGGFGLLGVVLGAALVLFLGFVFFNGGLTNKPSSTVNVQLPKPGH